MTLIISLNIQDGRLFQVEYAYKAVDNAGSVPIFCSNVNSTAIGLRVKDGVILAVEKLVASKLLLPGANRRIQTIDRHMGVVISAPGSSNTRPLLDLSLMVDRSCILAVNSPVTFAKTTARRFLQR